MVLCTTGTLKEHRDAPAGAFAFHLWNNPLSQSERKAKVERRYGAKVPSYPFIPRRGPPEISLRLMLDRDAEGSSFKIEMAALPRHRILIDRMQNYARIHGLAKIDRDAARRRGQSTGDGPLELEMSRDEFRWGEQDGGESGAAW